MTPNQTIERAQRATAAHGEFIGPVCDALRAEYLAALTQLAANEPWETAKITKLAVALRVIDTVEQHISAAIACGKPAESDQARAAQIAKLPEAKRKWI